MVPALWWVPTADGAGAARPPSRPLDWERSRSGRSPGSGSLSLLWGRLLRPCGYPAAYGYAYPARDFASHEARFTTTGAILSATSGCGWLAEAASWASSSEFRRDRRTGGPSFASRIKRRRLAQSLRMARTRGLRCFLPPTLFVDERTHSWQARTGEDDPELPFADPPGAWNRFQQLGLSACFVSPE